MNGSGEEVRLWMARCIIGQADARLALFDSQVLLDFAQEQGVVVLLYDAITAAGAERNAAVLKPAALGLIAQELGRLAEARHVLSQLAQAELSTLVLKGTALAYRRYPKPAQRSRCDFDILVRDRTSALQAITALQGIGYEWAGTDMRDVSGFEVALHRRAAGGSLHRIDLHWRLLNNAVLTDGWAFDKLWERSIEIPALHPCARGLGPVDALLHAALHRLTNIPSERHDRLIWLYDIHLLVRDFEAHQWCDTMQVCKDKQVAAPLLDALSATRNSFGTYVPPEVEASLDAMTGASRWQLRSAFDAGSLDRAHLGALPWREKLVWLWRKLFPSPHFMRVRYGDGAVGVSGLVRAYLSRWWMGIRRAVGGVPAVSFPHRQATRN